MIKIVFLAIVSIVGLSQVMSDASFDVTFNHVVDREQYATVGYIPTSGSGVTIGIGIDLGQQTKSGLKAKGISDAIISKVEKYLGYKTEADVNKANLKASNLVLTSQEALDLSKPFISEAYSVCKPYAAKMTDKGLAVLVSLRHWAGSLGCSNCKLSVIENKVDTNHVWNTIKDKTATNKQLKTSLEKTLLGKSVGTAAYNRIKHEITYLN